MATVCAPATGRVSASFAAVAKHYAVQVAICPPRRGNRKGVVEKAVHTAAQRIWRNMPDQLSVEAAQTRFDTWCATRGDLRVRATANGKDTIKVIAAREPLRPVPDQPFPAITAVTRRVSAQALVAYAGNFYSVAPEHTGATVAVLVRLGSTYLDITTTTSPPLVLARHRLQPAGAGVMVRDDVHVAALNTLAMRSASSPRPHRRKERIPPGPAAQAAAALLRGGDTPDPATPVVDLTQYAKAAHGRNTLT